jgi:pentatricopeptide repeat protein
LIGSVGFQKKNYRFCLPAEAPCTTHWLTKSVIFIENRLKAIELTDLIDFFITDGLGGLRIFFAAHRILKSWSWTMMVGGRELCKLGLVDEARKVFDSMPERNPISSWNAMISGYVGREVPGRSGGVRQNEGAWGGEERVCGGKHGGSVHGHRRADTWEGGAPMVEQSGIEMDKKLATAVVDM